VVDLLGSVVLLKNGEKSAISLYEVLNNAPVPKNQTAYSIANSLELLGYDVAKESGKWRVTFYWHCLHKTDKDISVFFNLEDKDGRVIYESFAPLCYRIYPTYAWREGEYIKETKFLPFAGDLKKQQTLWKMGFYDFQTGEGYIANDRDIFGRIDLNLS